VLVVLHLMATHTRPYHWYLIPFMPAMLALWAAALNWCWRRSRPGALGLMSVLVIGIHAMAWPQSKLLAAHPIEANRESVALTRKITNPRHPDYGRDAITAVCVMTPGCYDPAALTFKTVTDLRSIIERAKSEHRPLFVNVGFRAFYKTEFPEVLAMLDDKTLFEPVAAFPGLFFSTSREVLHCKGTP
jgi:hypothetical protein